MASACQRTSQRTVLAKGRPDLTPNSDHLRISARSQRLWQAATASPTRSSGRAAAGSRGQVRTARLASWCRPAASHPVPPGFCVRTWQLHTLWRTGSHCACTRWHLRLEGWTLPTLFESAASRPVRLAGRYNNTHHRKQQCTAALSSRNMQVSSYASCWSSSNRCVPAKLRSKRVK